MIRRTPLSHLFAAACGLSLALACDPPQCIDGPAQTPLDTAACAAPPVAADPQIAVAHAEWLGSGDLVITWTSFGLECGTRALDVPLTDDCERTGWVFTVEIPAALAVAGTIDLDAHPEVIGTMTVMDGGSGGQTGTIGDEPFFTGQLELTGVAADCVTGVLHGFGSGIADPTLGGPELNGGFSAPTC
ncbi:hypothetical protein SAMN02745121_05271 [Nannocystis exedens]|uniref:Lipoprotein n=1 Tax=Nannocystis exedens TaxID=54 RepID=A0A1I2CUV2_9BACT|nr:hypothetical protein [Nannocystis exedens]PCC68597.1 hypothetical protein NAEX_01613 [Nannocystis exedens]SFE72081.1 hypothetical protein SAMN02745121_05271 [Nannocystis exedens]